MSSIISKLANKLFPVQYLPFSRSYISKTYPKNNLYSRISPLGDPSLSVVSVLNKWVDEGKKVNDHELQFIVKNLRHRKRYAQALEVSEWMTSKGICSSPGGRAVQLDLIGRVRGLDAAESYFNNNVEDKDKIDKLYGALLNCYVREGQLEKSFSHLQKMKEMGFASSLLTYNDIMCLYTKTHQLEKIPEVLSEMKRSGVAPDRFSYRICINSYGARSEISNMEKILEENEKQPHVSTDWTTYTMVANYCIKADLKEKARIYLKKAEEMIKKDALGFNHLISLYANLGSKSEMMRLWRLQKLICKKQLNRDYITMLGCLVKLGDLEETERLLEEWDSACETYDFRVPNVLLNGYSQKGMIEKAEDKLKDFVKKGRTPTPNSWSIVAAGYIDKGNMQKAFECMKEALTVKEENKGWRPNPKTVTVILSWLGEKAGAEEIKTFVDLLKTKVPANSEMYLVLLKSCIRDGGDVGKILDCMKADGVDVDEEINKILNLRQEKAERSDDDFHVQTHAV